MNAMNGLNYGHGHVYPRADRALARCGGPGHCAECSIDFANRTMKDAQENANSTNNGFNVNETNADLIAQMARINGRAGVLKKIVEECAELITAISKGDVNNIAEECQDVMLVIEQLKWVMPSGHFALEAKFRDEKIERIRGLVRDHEAMERVRMATMNVEADQGDDAEVNG